MQKVNDFLTLISTFHSRIDPIFQKFAKESIMSHHVMSSTIHHGSSRNISSSLSSIGEIDDTMCIMPLGGGQEVGRSCILLQFRGRNIMLDCGAHPGREGNDSLPFFDSLDDPSEIDLILITHFHIDHCAALPYFTEKTNFKGKIYMTHATKAVMKMLLSDNIKLQTRSRPLYSEQELQSCVDKIEVVDYHQTVEYKGNCFLSIIQTHTYMLTPSPPS